jgi:hypothetical protein
MRNIHMCAMVIGSVLSLSSAIAAGPGTTGSPAGAGGHAPGSGVGTAPPTATTTPSALGTPDSLERNPALPQAQPNCGASSLPGEGNRGSPSSIGNGRC